MNRFTPFALLVAGALVVGLSAGCKTDDKDDHGKSSKMDKSGKPLWDRLGGEGAVTAVVEDFVGRAAKDDANVNFFRKGTPVEWKPTDAEVKRFKRLLVEFISSATGGPLKYTGRSMAASHRGMKITNKEFDALAGHLAASLDKFKVPKKEKDELLKIVGGTRNDIVNK